MLTEIEKIILIRIGYSKKYLNIKGKYLYNGSETPIIKVQEIKKRFKELSEFSYNYAGERSHVLTKKIENFEVIYNFIIRQNAAEVRYHIRKNGKNIGLKFSHIGMPLRYIPYDESLINHNFGFNTIEDLMNFVNEITEFLDEVVKEYIIEIKKGNFVIT